MICSKHFQCVCSWLISMVYRWEHRRRKRGGWGGFSPPNFCKTLLTDRFLPAKTHEKVDWAGARRIRRRTIRRGQFVARTIRRRTIRRRTIRRRTIRRNCVSQLHWACNYWLSRETPVIMTVKQRVRERGQHVMIRTWIWLWSGLL